MANSMSLSDLPFHLSRLHQAYEAGVTVEEVVAEAFRRIEAADDPGIFIYLAELESIRAQTSALGPFDRVAKPLWGAPVAVKDNIDVAGMPTTGGAPDFAYLPAKDAFAVAKLKAAGAIVIGKTNLDQFATGLVGVRTPYPIPRNALDPEIVPGGSSSGSAVAVARGLVSLALGTDTAGSGRIPAALNNIVGLKPSLGAISGTGMLPACRTLDTISIFALTVPDAMVGLEALAGYDAEDAYSRSSLDLRPAPIPSRFKVGVPDGLSREFFGDKTQATAFEAALREMASLGGELVQVDFTPFFRAAKLLYEGPWVAERYAALREVIEERPEIMHSTTRTIVAGAAGYSAADAFDAAYEMAGLRRAVAPVLASLDCLCVPSMPTFYSLADLEADPIQPNARLGTYTNFVNLMDLCGMAVPTAPRRDGRPGSVTLLARWGRDSFVAALANAIHERSDVPLGGTGWALPASPASAAVAGHDEIAVALVGAHMQGLPLNHEVAGRGGRFLQEAKTAADYRLYSLAGGPPKRPGMVRMDDGAEISLEIWAMPLSAFGAFMAGIPQPLGIGTINLADGSQVKGFLCEPAGLEGAQDITAFGGWRAFLASI